MNYEIQRGFLRRQRDRLLPSAVASAVFLVEAIREPRPIGERILGASIAIAFAWAAYYLPNYLGLDADVWRRPYWFSRARWVALFLFGLVALFAGAKLALGAVFVAALLHAALRRFLLKLERHDPRHSIPARLMALAVVYAATDCILFWLACREGASPLLLSELLACFLFFLAVLLWSRSSKYVFVFSLASAALCYFVIGSAAPQLTRDMLTAAVFVWTAGTIYLYVKAVQHNAANYEDLLENLQAFLGQSRESVLGVLHNAVTTLADNWRRDQPKGQEAVAAWYSANASLYLLANCQHHLLYRHIMYTLGLLKVARGRVLDFGGGNGDFSRALARDGFDTTYLDVPGDAARYVKWRAEREGLPLKVTFDKTALQAPYDVVFCLDVVEHLVDLPPIFELFRQLLRPGGKLLATYYNGPTSSAPMHIDPGYDALAFLLAHGFRNVKSKVVSVFSPELMHKNHFMILEKEPS